MYDHPSIHASSSARVSRRMCFAFFRTYMLHTSLLLIDAPFIQINNLVETVLCPTKFTSIKFNFNMQAKSSNMGT